MLVDVTSFGNTFFLIIHELAFNQEVLPVPTYGLLMIPAFSTSNHNETKLDIAPPPFVTYKRTTQIAPPTLPKVSLLRSSSNIHHNSFT